MEYDTRLTASAGGALVLMQPEICRNYNYYYDIEALGNRVTECGRFRQAAALDDGRVVGVRLEAGEAEVAVVGGEVLYRAAPGESITGVAAGAARIAVTTLRAGCGPSFSSRRQGGSRAVGRCDQAFAAHR